MSIHGHDEYLTICQECGCVFDYFYAYKAIDKEKGYADCPACKHTYELKRNW